MSQEKVELRKAQKGNIKSDIKKEKKKRVLFTIIGVVVAVVIVAWIAISIVFSVKNKKSSGETEVNLDAIQNYMQELDADDTVSDEADE